VTLYLPGQPPFLKVRSSSAFDAFRALQAARTADAADTFDPIGFGGQQGYYRDCCGLYLLGHRYYDASAGRFVNRDPIGYQGGINLYGFAGNNPVNESDPSGFDPDDDQSQQLSLGGRLRAFGNAPQFRPGSKERRDYSGFLSQVPGVGTAMAAHEAVTGRNAMAGTRSSGWSRFCAVATVALASTGALHNLFGEGESEIHHIATDKHDIWTPRFQELFGSVGLSLQSNLNKVRLINHGGRHPAAYHQWVYSQLEDSIQGLSGAAARQAFTNQLLKIKSWLHANPSHLNSGGPYPKL